MEKPELLYLARIRWQFFGSLTFRAADVPERVRLSMWTTFTARCHEALRLYFPNSLWCLRQEAGEVNGRRHFHYLLGGFPQSACTISSCFAQMFGWMKFLPECRAHEKVFCKICLAQNLKGTEHWREVLNPAKNVGGGSARVRLFNPSLNGVDYIVDCLSERTDNLMVSGADRYESAKFGIESSELMLSKGAQALLARGIREERRFIERLNKTRGEGEVGKAKTNVFVPPVPRHSRKESSDMAARGDISSMAFSQSVNSWRSVTDAVDRMIDLKASVVKSGKAEHLEDFLAVDRPHGRKSA